MKAPVCTVIEAAEMASLGHALALLWAITVVGFLLTSTDWLGWEWRIRRSLRRRRMQRIRIRRLVADDVQ